MSDPNVKEKFKQTMQQNHGVDHPSQLEYVKQKKKDTCMINYGVEYPGQSAEIKKMIKKTIIEKYGVEHVSQSQEIKDKIKQTNIEKYGFAYAMQNPDVAERCSKASYSSKPYEFPSGNIVHIQGYENYAIDLLLDMGYAEDDLVLRNRDKPQIWYDDPAELTKKRKHYVDIYIPKDNWCIEVKSTWTFKRDEAEVHAKKAAAEVMGYVYHVWIIDKAEIIEII